MDMNKFAKIAVAAAAPLLLAAAPPTTQDRADIRCLIVSYQLASNADAEIKNAGIIVSQYYLGLLDGRSPGLDLEALIEAESKGIDEAQMKALLQRCGSQVEKRGKEIEAIGARLQKKGV
jgi:hypothetical protein